MYIKGKITAKLCALTGYSIIYVFAQTPVTISQGQAAAAGTDCGVKEEARQR